MSRILELCMIIGSVIVAVLLVYYGNVPIDLKAIVNYAKGKSNSPKEFPLAQGQIE